MLLTVPRDYFALRAMDSARRGAAKSAHLRKTTERMDENLVKSDLPLTKAG